VKPDQPEDLTQLLNRSVEGDGLPRALPLIYDQLRALARRHLSGERPGHTLSPTALVHEAYLKLNAQRQSHWQNRAQFFAVASMAMRRILVNHARDRVAAKRGSGAVKLELDEAAAEAFDLTARDRLEEILTVDQLLKRLEAIDPRATRVVECRYFAGYTNEETAEALEVSVITVKRAWRLAQAWLARELTGG